MRRLAHWGSRCVDVASVGSDPRPDVEAFLADGGTMLQIAYGMAIQSMFDLGVDETSDLAGMLVVDEEGRALDPSDVVTTSPEAAAKIAAIRFLMAVWRRDHDTALAVFEAVSDDRQMDVLVMLTGIAAQTAQGSG